MEPPIRETDWKLLRRLQPLALDRLCQAILSDIVRLASDDTQGSHARYLEVFKVIQERDKEIAAAFNDLRRSTALVQLAHMRSLGLVTDDEFLGFSAETQEVVAFYLKR